MDGDVLRFDAVDQDIQRALNKRTRLKSKTLLVRIFG